MVPLYPLRFRPLLRSYLWGGRRLAELGKPLGDEPQYAESWELCDRDADQSVVAEGPLAGTTLGELVRERGPELLGCHHPQPRFPLLFKFLDSQRVLSVQVHPNDAAAARRQPPDLGKTEAWVILDAQPGAVLYAGFAHPMTAAAVRQALADGVLERCLHRVEPRPGDAYFIPAGQVHALGAGLLVAEIQQSSDVTYRLFDWNRLGPDGRPRPLHVEEALAAIDFRLLPGQSAAPRIVPDRPYALELVACDQFRLERWTLDAALSLAADDRCWFLAVLSGELEVSGDPAAAPLARGGTCLLPADVSPIVLAPRGRSELLAMTLP